MTQTTTPKTHSNIKRYLYEAILGERNRIYYITKFEQFDLQGIGLKASWNWPAFLVGGGWALYRKMYGWFFAFWGITALSSMFQKSGSEVVGAVIYFGFAIPFGVFANSLYHKKMKERIATAQLTIPDDSTVLEWLKSRGGVNRWVPWVGVSIMVVALLGIIAAIAIPNYMVARKKAQESGSSGSASAPIVQNVEPPSSPGSIARPVPAPAPPASSPAARQSILKEILSRGTVRIGYEQDAPPMYFKNSRGSEDGFEYQLARELSSGIGQKAISPIYVPSAYQDLPDKLRKGQIDLLLAGYVPDPSLSGIDWSDSYLDFGLCLIVLRESAVTDISQLAGKTVAIYDDPAAERWVKRNIPGAHIKAFTGDSGWFEALKNREADALVYDYPWAAEEIKNHPSTKIVQFNLNYTRYTIGIPAGNADLLNAVNADLARIKSSAGYGDLVRRYLSYKSEDAMKPIAGRKTHIVRSGETLSSIAHDRLGASERWEEIWQLNRNRIANPYLVYPDYVLLMP